MSNKTLNDTVSVKSSSNLDENQYRDEQHNYFKTVWPVSANDENKIEVSSTYTTTNSPSTNSLSSFRQNAFEKNETVIQPTKSNAAISTSKKCSNLNTQESLCAELSLKIKLSICKEKHGKTTRAGISRDAQRSAPNNYLGSKLNTVNDSEKTVPPFSSAEQCTKSVKQLKLKSKFSSCF